MVFEGVRFEAPERFVQFDGPPRPPGPFLRLKNGERDDPHAEFIEAMSAPLAEVGGRITPESFSDYALTPADRYCGSHEVLRNETRAAGEAVIVDVGYVCLRHSRQRQYSRQVVRTVAVFADGKFTSFLFVRMWRAAPHPDDALTAEQWMAPTDAVALSVAPCGEAC